MSVQFPGKGCFAAVVVGITLANACQIGRSAERGSEQARRILDATGVKGGLIVHVGCGGGKLTAALRAADNVIVQGLDADAANVEKARAHIRSLGLYGPVSAVRFDGEHLPYVDNLVNLIVVEDPGKVSMDEAMRVLAPLGGAYVKRDGKWEKTVKPWPKEIDQWTHCLYDATGNAVARDSRVGPPRHIQWVGGPRRARQHERLGSVSVVVSAGGRIFSIQDEGSIASVILPAKWFLVARNAFSGVVLWRRHVGPWEGHLRDFRSGPPELSRRLVAVGDRVFVTLGYGKPVSALDAATGKTVREYQGTDGTSEIIYAGGVLFLVIEDAPAEESPDAARRRDRDTPPRKKRILAIQADTGKVLWENSDTGTLMPTTLAVGGDRLFFQNLKEVVCLDAKTGKRIWASARPVTARRPTWSAPTLVVYKNVVLSADRATPADVQKKPEKKHPSGWIDAPTGQLVALSARTGETLWNCACRESFHAAVDVLVADGLVWTGELAHAKDPGITVGRDPMTGEIKRRRPLDKEFFEVGMPHHRCYRNRATDRYLVLGRAGVEFIDLASGDGIANHWVRGTCQYGVVPCNGLLYAPPHSCACYTKAKLNGFCALSSGPVTKDRKVSRQGRLERGPAYGKTRKEKPEIGNGEDWPTYRHDQQRSGSTKMEVPVKLKAVWEAEIGGRLSSVTIAGGNVFVAAVDEHAVHALDAKDGRPLWRYVTGGRIDSPPTICTFAVPSVGATPSGGAASSLCLFGSADGWVYCLRASDGALVWRFRAAAEDRRIVAHAQIESVWPAHGSVLVDDGVAYVAAGRSSYLDGGIRLLGLDPATGEKLFETRIDSRDPKTGRQPKGTVRGFDLPGALPDVLSSDGAHVYMRHLAFDRKGKKQPQPPPHLFSPTGLLDGSWWHRSYWIFGTEFYTGYRDWFRAGREVPGGRMLVLDKSSVYGYGRTPRYYYWSTPQKYHLFATDKRPKIIESPTKRGRVPQWGQREIVYRWSEEIPLRVRAMVLADKTLFIAGPPELVDEEDAYRRIGAGDVFRKLAEQDAALAGKKGAMLWAVSTADGSKLANCRLDAPPVWDGMAAANKRLYVSTVDGRVVCLGGKQGERQVKISP